jgi:hypothetical protein
LLTSGAAATTGFEDDGGAHWRLEPITPPDLPNGERSPTPIGLGRVGDIEFWRPDRGLLITAGNGTTIPAGTWAFDGLHWHELSTVCGATDGRIAWAGPAEFWTVSDARQGQAADSHGDPAPTEDNTLCHFVNGSVAASYASLAFQASSYQPMHAAACLSTGDCWFAGDGVPEPQIGAFHVHWNGRASTLEEIPYLGEGRPVEDMRAFDGSLYESVRVSSSDPVLEHLSEPPTLHLINPIGVNPTFEPLSGLPLHSAGEFPEALDALRLSADAEALWAAAGPRRETPEGSEAAQVTIDRYTPGTGWSQVLGSQAGGLDPFSGDTVRSIAAEPQSEAAWVALAASSETGVDPTANALVARVSADGTVSDEETLPTPAEAAEGVGPKGAAAHVSCPAVHECWLATTEGWLFHLTSLPAGSPTSEGIDADPAFAGPITYRPPDEGLPATTPDAPPPDDSGAQSEFVPAAETVTPPRALAGLVSKVHVRLVHATTLELRFHLTVKATVRLLARRHRQIVATTPRLTLKAGYHTLRLHLQRRRWPTKLDLQTHALAPLPTVAADTGTSTAIIASHKPPTRWARTHRRAG